MWRKTPHHNRGFTLLEVMVALFIFAILAVIVAVGLRTILRTHEHVKLMDAQIQKMEVGFAVMQRDFSQLIDRPTLDSRGTQQAALLAAGGSAIAFTTAGYVNPMAASKRSQLMRVAYSVADGALVRTVWPVLDLAPNTKAQHRILITGVSNMVLQFANQYGQVVNAWIIQPGGGTAGSDPHADMPRAVIMTLDFANGMKIKRVFAIAGAGLGDSNV